MVRSLPKRYTDRPTLQELEQSTEDSAILQHALDASLNSVYAQPGCHSVLLVTSRPLSEHAAKMRSAKVTLLVIAIGPLVPQQCLMRLQPNWHFICPDAQAGAQLLLQLPLPCPPMRVTSQIGARRIVLTLESKELTTIELCYTTKNLTTVVATQHISTEHVFTLMRLTPSTKVFFQWRGNGSAWSADTELRTTAGMRISVWARERDARVIRVSSFRRLRSSRAL